VVGEDLGVVPDEMRQAMPEFGLYHYKVLLFEKIDGRFGSRRICEARTGDGDHARHADIAQLLGSRDIELRRRLNLFPSADIENEIVRERAHDREMLLSALRIKP